MQGPGSNVTATVSPELRTFIERVIVPALVERFLAEARPHGKVDARPTETVDTETRPCA